MSTPRRQVLVLGAGVCGLSSALRIQELCDQVDVTIMADKFSPNTTSDGAAGFWEILDAGTSDQQFVLDMGTQTYNHLLDLANSPMASVVKVQKVSGYHLWNYRRTPELIFKDVVTGFRNLTEKEISKIPDATDGRFFTSLTVDVPLYLKWLMNKFISNGGHIIKRKINSLLELNNEWDVVVNCTGIGSYDLMNDKAMYPVRGQVFRVFAPWIKHFYVFDQSEGESTKLTYILPNSDTVVVGGVFQKDRWDLSVDEQDTKNIWADATKLLPSLENSKILKQWVGLRPGRDCFRLEPEVINITSQNRTMNVVHNYGHGGKGINLHWGCAGKTTELVSQFLEKTEEIEHGLKIVNKTVNSKL